MEWQDSFGLGIGAVTHAVNLTVLEEVSVYAVGSLFWNRNLAATVAIQGRGVCLQIDGYDTLPTSSQRRSQIWPQGHTVFVKAGDIFFSLSLPPLLLLGAP